MDHWVWITGMVYYQSFFALGSVCCGCVIGAGSAGPVKDVTIARTSDA